jgi:L-alanine-DL-glutamate epimerase-like enolase superfamily enzyme
VHARAYTVPTDQPESDGTLEWDSTTMVLVEIEGGGVRGTGYTYTDASAAALIERTLGPAVLEHGCGTGGVRGSRDALVHASRNLGVRGVVACAISALEMALWDLCGLVRGVCVADLLGAGADRVPIYGSGGFTSYTPQRLAVQLGGWVSEGIPRVKMKVGREPGRDAERVRAARRAAGPDAELYVDANGAYACKQALAMAEVFAGEAAASWFEEPVPSADRAGLRLIRERAPAGMEIAAGEYSYALADSAALLAAGSVDVLQVDATRCGGFTGVLQADALAAAAHLPLSVHGAPAISAHVGAAAGRLRHLEYFHDHVRVEAMLLDGLPERIGGDLRIDRSRPGHGLTLKGADAERYRVA